MIQGLKHKLPEIFRDFIRINLSVSAVILLIRVAQYFSLFMMHSLPFHAVFLEFRGFLMDVILWQYLSWILLIPFILFSLTGKWIGRLFFGLFSFILLCVEWGLFQYFSLTLRPLDQVVFSYTLKEMMMITGSCVKFNLITFLPFILILIFLFFGIYFFLKIKLKKNVLLSITIVSIMTLFLIGPVTPKENQSRNPFEYYVVYNKTAYFLEKCRIYFSRSQNTGIQSDLDAIIKRYHRDHPEFKFLGNQYPFLHDENTPDVLGAFFDFQKDKPNLVFIIVESLSSCFMGNNDIFGSFAPFLDSLSAHSLYWNNFLATADRTFNVLPAMFASLPPGDPTFINEAGKMPYHLSMIRYLRESGYYASFFYSGDPSFNYMEDFLERQSTDYILRTFGAKYKKYVVNEGYGWGFPDLDLYHRSFEVMDSVKKSPRLDIYLTLSLHSPFIPPRQDYYLALLEDRIKKMNPSMELKQDLKKYKNIFSTILYTDDALRSFFERYKTRPEFGNTIFIITGDHALPELNLFRFSGLEHYHVPLIIYSPMLKAPVHFRSVSSHLDITPSFLALLNKRFNVKIQSVAPWMGRGIDTAQRPRNIHILPFILNNKEIVEYVNKQYYFSSDVVLLIQPDLKLRKIRNSSLLQRMNRELNDFKTLNTYVTKQNRLIPPELFFKEISYSEEIRLTDSIVFNPSDSTGEFRSMIRDLSFGPEFHTLKLEIEFLAGKFKAEPNKDPLVVLDLYQKSGRHLRWQSFKIPETEKPERWYPVKIMETVDLTSLNNSEDYVMHMYIWNRSKLNLKLDQPKVKITGFYTK